MLDLLNVNDFTKGLDLISSTEIATKDGGFHVNGLFSESIFGTVGSNERRTTYAYIDLGANVIHPTMIRFLYRLDGKIKSFISTEHTYEVDKETGELVQSPDGVSGIAAFIKLFPKIKFNLGTPAREKINASVQAAYKDKSIFINKLPVIPPGYRDAYQDESGDWVVDKLNDYYITIMRRAVNVTTSSGSGILFDLMNYGLQQAVIDHDKYIQTRIAKKSGIIRSQMLGKRIDFSARSVITPGPDLKINEIGIPLRIAATIFEPFLIHRLLYSGIVDQDSLSKEVEEFVGIPLSVDSVRKVIKSIRVGDKIPEALYNIFAESTEAVMHGRAVIAKRDPALHAESVRAFTPILTHGNNVQICTLQVTGFNADFDGDTMLVCHPLSNEAQEEIQEKMMKAKSGESSTAITFELNKEMYVGLYTITKDIKSTKAAIAVTDKDLEDASNPYIPVVYRKQNTTMGKAIFNSCFPPTFPYVNKLITKKVVNKIIDELFKKYDDDIVRESVSKLAKVGFKFATIIAPSISIQDFELPPAIYEIKKKLDKVPIDEAQRLLDDAQKILAKHLEDTGFHDLIESGSGKGWSQPMQILVAKGIIADPDGNVLEPIKGSFADGLSNEEFYNAAPGAMKGIIDRVHNTAETGYLSRRLAFVLNTVEADPYLRDCKTKRTLNLKAEPDLVRRMVGRFVLKNGKPVLFDPNDFKTGDLIQLRSPIYCESPKICYTCYGELIKRVGSPYIGIVSAQIIGERGTQLIMRTFHTGGATKIDEKDMISDIIDGDAFVTKDVVKSKLRQEGNSLVCLDDCKITIGLNNYESEDVAIKEDENVVWLRSLICNISFEDTEFSIILDYIINVNIINGNIEGNTKSEVIQLNYPKGSTILECTLESVELKKQIQFIDRLLSGREIYKNTEHVFRRIFKIYQEHSGMDLVHLEVLLSNCFRWKDNLAYPARLGKTWDPVMINVKNLVFNTGFVNGLAFENITKAIEMGLIAQEDVPPSVLEKVMTGTLIEETKK